LEFWNLIFLNPILNFLILLSGVLFSNFGLAIIALTIIVRLVILPLTLKQLRSSRAMSDGMRELQPKLQQIQKKYAKNKVKLQQETMKLYKEAGINPMGCLTSPMLITMIIQMPIFFAVYRAIIQATAITPQDFLGLSEHLYSWSIVQQALPVSEKFLWLHLASPDPYFLIPIFTEDDGPASN
jgi:YidC/Oxa1 family membrane protein insertase